MKKINLIRSIVCCAVLSFFVSEFTLADSLVIDPNGNVGINRDIPEAQLDVNGTIRAEEICDETGNNCIDLSDGPSGRTLLFSQHVQANSAASQGDCENPRYVSFDVTDIIKDNCAVSETDPSYLYLVVDTFRNDSYAYTRSFEFRLIYFPVGYFDNTKEVLLRQKSYNSWYRIDLNDGAAGSADWDQSYAKFTLCERHGDNCGTWVTDATDDGKLYLTSDRQYSEAWHTIFKIIKAE